MAEIIDLDQVKAGVASAGATAALTDAPCSGTDYVCAGNDQPCGIDWACKSGNDAECSVEDHACNGVIVSEVPAQPAQVLLDV
jgi:hypothetical protein